jgi:hypothetical protein
VTSPTHADLVRTEVASNSPPVEVACDESGYEGEKLIRTTTDVFAHASVRLDIESATNGVQEIRYVLRRRNIRPTIYFINRPYETKVCSRQAQDTRRVHMGVASSTSASS